ncbi:MAG: zwf, glucose-6-phosphate 1-dehydrogenase [Candidatus Saccharibacteria bacterium]|nr:zwf, glucose-6-phosphate 1-dehydrogenase [Candidatus Saccharibacteria bacterium]
MKTKLVIFGITGDLSTRKLLPALAQIISTGDFDDLSVIGVSRRDIDVYELLSSKLGDTSLESRIAGFSMDTSNLDDYKRLKDFINLGDEEQLLLYLSVPPGASSGIVELLGQAGLNMPEAKLLLEKPFGVDVESARQMIDHVGKYYDESQVYRIDHYLAKEMTQNIIAFRGGNALFDHVWNSSAIERIEVVALEEIGIEGRAQFYEQTGALRDVLQGHLMQLLALVLMDVPLGLDWDDAAKMRLDALNSVALADPSRAVRGQYEGYRDEVSNDTSETETFASVNLTSNASQWQGVPILLASGKGMDKKATEVRVHFRKSHESQTNCLIFNIQPHEGIEIELYTKRPGYDHELETQTLSFMYPAEEKLPDAYEQVIVDAIRSRKSLFASSEEVLRAWEILTPVQGYWNSHNDDLKLYKKGSSLDTLIA